MISTSIFALLATVALALSPMGSTPTNPDDANMQARVDTVLAANPGGEQTAWNVVSWDDGAVVLTLAPENSVGSLTVGGCATGKHCAYNGVSYTGDKLTYSTCTSHESVSALPGTVRSMANSRSSGSIKAYSSSSTLLATATAGHGTNVGGTTSYISCS